MQEFLTHYTECTKNPSLFWNIIVFLIFGAESFQKHDVKHSSCKSLKTINALILHKEFQGKCKQTCEILSAGISDNRIMQLVEEMFDRQQKAIWVQRMLFSVFSLSKMASRFFHPLCHHLINPFVPSIPKNETLRHSFIVTVRNIV